MSCYIDPSRLQLGDIIGKGTFGVILRGSFRDVDGQKYEVAIKQVLDESTPAPSSSSLTPKENFMREVSVTIPTSKESDHVVQCHGWTATQDGKLALVMTLYDKSLYTHIDEQGGRALPLQEVVEIALDMAKGLLVLHIKGIVFEDLKPSNVLLNTAGRAFLADFGVSKPIKDMSKVYTSHVMGTYLFMPPEKLRPRSSAKARVGFAADVWSFGITVLQLLCSDLDAPYGPGIDIPDIVFMLHVDKEAPRVPSVPDAPELQHTLQACLSLDHNERPSAAQLVQALQRISHCLGADTQPSVTAARGSPAPPDARGDAALQAQLAAAEAKAAAAEAKAAAADQQLAEKEARHRQELARAAQGAEQEGASAAARVRQKQQQQQQAVRPLQLLSSPTCSATLEASSTVRSVTFTPDGASLVSGLGDSSIKLWDLASNKCTATLEGHSGTVCGVAISPDGRLLASGARDSTLRLWDLDSRKCAATFTGHRGWWLLHRVDGRFVPQPNQPGDVFCVAISPDGAMIASGSYDETIRLWDSRSGNCKAVLDRDRVKYSTRFWCVWCVAFSADGTRLASGDGSFTLRVWDVHSACCIAELRGHHRAVSTVVFSADGATLLSGSWDSTIKVWDTHTWRCLKTLGGHTSGVNSVALTPGGQHIVSGSEDKTIKIWDWKGSGACLATLEGHSKRIYCLAVSPDGKALASGSYDETIKLWHIAQ